MGKEINYNTIPDPYNNQLERTDSVGKFDVDATMSVGSPNQMGANVIDGGTISNLWLKSWIKSVNYKPKTSGFLIDGIMGKIECKDIELTGGIVSFGKTSFTDSTNAGYIWSSDGLYVGSAGDASALKYTISSGDFIFKGAITITSGTGIENLNGGDLVTMNESEIEGSNIVNGEGWTDDAAANAAQADADTAQATALSKAKVFRQTTPPSSGMVIGDIWLDTNDGNRPYSYSGSSWIETLTIIDGGKITTGTIDASVVTVNNINAGNINTGTLSSILIQTSVYSNTGIKMSSALGGMKVYGENIVFKNTSGTDYGSIYGSTSFVIRSYSGKNLTIKSSERIFMSTENTNRSVCPSLTNIESLGDSTYQWLNLKSRYLQTERSITLASTGSPLSDNGTIYFSGTHFYGRISGSWVQLDN